MRPEHDDDEAEPGPVASLDREPVDARSTTPSLNTAHSVGLVEVPALMQSLRRIAAAIDGMRHRIGEQLGLDPTAVTALVTIYDCPGIQPKDLARTLGIGSAGLTALVDRLVRATYVYRDAIASDRRAFRLRVTPSGRQAAQWIVGVIVATGERCCEAGDDMALYVSVLDHLADTMASLEPRYDPLNSSSADSRPAAGSTKA